jgi:hypothetical protein
LPCAQLIAKLDNHVFSRLALQAERQGERVQMCAL